MKITFPLVFAVAGLALLGMGEKQRITVRFYLEANEQDTEKFATPVKLHNPERGTYIEKTPVINERMVKAIYPFRAENGTWGCSFVLDESGRISLDVASTSRRGSTMIAFVSTKAATHQVVDMLIDKAIHDGIITIPFGMTEIEIGELTKEYRVLGQKQPKKKGPFS